MSTRSEATIRGLYNVLDNLKAEVVDGEVVPMPPTGRSQIELASKSLCGCMNMNEEREVESLSQTMPASASICLIANPSAPCGVLHG